MVITTTRREAMFTQSTLENATNGYYGLRSGIQIPGAEVAHAYSNYKVKTDSRLLWMNAAEVAFLRAEGALRNWNMGGTASDFYKKGVELSFEQWGVKGAAAYLSDNTRTLQSIQTLQDSIHILVLYRQSLLLGMIMTHPTTS